MKSITIGKDRDGRPVAIDVATLINSRLLIQAGSGGGKSNALRLLAEGVGGHVQFIIIDREGEFYTLREKVDLLWVGGSGELAATPRNAGDLAVKLLETGTSAVIDLYGLSIPDQKSYVRRFVENLNAAPRSLWHPVLVMIDEAHLFCPEKGQGEAESGDALELLASAGRKRGHCAVFATQRISKLSKNAAAELHTKLIGLATLDLDYKRAGQEIGLSVDESRQLRDLELGEFFAAGRALGVKGYQNVRLVQAATDAPQAGKKAANAAAPSAAIHALLPALAELGKAADADDVNTIDSARERIKALRGELAAAKRDAAKAASPAAVVKVDERAIARAVAERDKHWQGELAKVSRHGEGLAARLTKIAAIAHLNGEAAAPAVVPPAAAVSIARASPPAVRPRLTPSSNPGEAMPSGERAILTALAQNADGCERDQIGILTGYKRSTRDAYILRLEAKGFVDASRTPVVATQQGIEALGNFEPLPTGDALLQHWLGRLSEGEGKILRLLAEAWPNVVPRDGLSEYKRSTRDAYLRRLGARRLVSSTRDGVKASDLLFDGAIV